MKQETPKEKVVTAPVKVAERKPLVSSKQESKQDNLAMSELRDQVNKYLHEIKSKEDKIFE